MHGDMVMARVPCVSVADAHLQAPPQRAHCPRQSEQKPLLQSLLASPARKTPRWISGSALASVVPQKGVNKNSPFSV
jgi:hypothetical protein